MKKFLQTLPAFTHKPCHPLQLLQNTTASEFTSKYCSGKVVVIKLALWNGDRKRVMENLCQIFTDLPPAPDEFLKMIRCNCHTDCSSVRCTCKKHNVKCSPACGNCRGSGCTNSNNPIHEDEYDIDNDTE